MRSVSCRGGVTTEWQGRTLQANYQTLDIEPENHDRRLKGGLSRRGGRHETKLEFKIPDNMLDTTDFGYSQVVSTRGPQLVFVSGQSSATLEGFVGDAVDKASQFDLVFDNIERAIAAIPGASLGNVVFVRTFVKDYVNETDFPLLIAFLKRFPNKPATEMAGVQALPVEGMLVEASVQLVL
ncbi:hypothetical protein BSKO_11066 [Bryopsis sp. KO-2023]|nr:hypothetical protein BSKO_11066 [Bryopsis sp. KO-2023]